MRNKLKILLFLCLSLTSSTFLVGQSQDNSPYSRFGIGDLNYQGFAHLRGMGQIGSSYVDPFMINIVNPASYSFLKATSFEAGVFAERSDLDDGVNQATSWDGGLNYLSLAFPLRNPINETLDKLNRDWTMGMNFTLISNSTVNYNISSFENLSDGTPVERNYKGSGGTTKFIWGNSVKYKDFAVGLNLGYLFGQISYDRNVFFFSTNSSYDDLFSTDYNLNGFYWNLGMIYELKLNKRQGDDDLSYVPKTIHFGMNINSNRNFNTNSTQLHRSIYQVTSTNTLEDTILNVSNVEGTGTLPSEFGIGATYKNGTKLALGVNYSLKTWSNYRNEANPETLSDAHTVSFGGYYRPDISSYNRYYKRIKYYFGAYYRQDPRSVDEENVETYAVTFGFGMPLIFQRNASHLNWGFELGSRGRNTRIQETFAKLTLGFTFNDTGWFYKRKYD